MGNVHCTISGTVGAENADTVQDRWVVPHTVTANLTKVDLNTQAGSTLERDSTPAHHNLPPNPSSKEVAMLVCRTFPWVLCKQQKVFAHFH